MFKIFEFQFFSLQTFSTQNCSVHCISCRITQGTASAIAAEQKFSAENEPSSSAAKLNLPGMESIPSKPQPKRRIERRSVLSNEESRHRFRSTVADQTDHADADHRRRQVTGRSAGATGQAGGDGCDRRGAQEFGTLGAGGAS